MTERPEALRIAERLERYKVDCSGYAVHCHKAAAELRRLHGECDALRKDAQRWAFIEGAPPPIVARVATLITTQRSYYVDACMKEVGK